MGGIEDLNKDITIIIVNITIFTQNYYSIWYDYDNFLLNDDTILTFRSADEAQDYCIHKFNEKTDIWNLNFDDAIISDCSLFLDKWNVVGDIAKTLNLDFIGNRKEFTNLYSKFVYGSNLPTMNNTGIEYIPSFDEEEKQQIENVTKDMIRILKLALEIDD